MTAERRPLLKAHEGLVELPHLAFAELPTPVERLSLNEGAELWVKRDDLTHRTYGGNKVRKLEFLLADARDRGCTRVATMGGIGTNHGLATAIFAREFGLACDLALFPQPVTDHVLRSLRLYQAYGATMHHFRTFFAGAVWLQWLHFTSTLGLRRERVAVFGPGGSSARGTLGFVNAALELAEQVRRGELPEPAVIVCALGSNGTLAGLALGVRLAGLRSRVVGVRVTPRLGANARLVAALANGSLGLLQQRGAFREQRRLRASDIEVEHGYYGAGYGHPTAAGEEALARAADLGLTLEPTYTAKTFAAVLAGCRRLPGPMLYWHTFSSADLSTRAATVSPTELPASFQRYFRSV